MSNGILEAFSEKRGSINGSILRALERNLSLNVVVSPLFVIILFELSKDLWVHDVSWIVVGLTEIDYSFLLANLDGLSVILVFVDSGTLGHNVLLEDVLVTLVALGDGHIDNTHLNLVSGSILIRLITPVFIKFLESTIFFVLLLFVLFGNFFARGGNGVHLGGAVEVLDLLATLFSNSGLAADADVSINTLFLILANKLHVLVNNSAVLEGILGQANVHPDSKYIILIIVRT